jgi:hypothetical protein
MRNGVPPLIGDSPLHDSILRNGKFGKKQDDGNTDQVPTSHRITIPRIVTPWILERGARAVKTAHPWS